VSNSVNEGSLTGRYALAGILNTAVGVAVLFALAYIGVEPLISNIIGYACGITVGFVSAKGFVFRSDGHIAHEAMRYLVAFAISYTANLIVLLLTAYVLGFANVLSQLLAITTYVIVMFFCTREYVFRRSGRA
jgi:putative flippase GtrA